MVVTFRCEKRVRSVATAQRWAINQTFTFEIFVVFFFVFFISLSAGSELLFSPADAENRSGPYFTFTLSSVLRIIEFLSLIKPLQWPTITQRLARKMPFFSTVAATEWPWNEIKERKNIQFSLNDPQNDNVDPEGFFLSCKCVYWVLSGITQLPINRCMYVYTRRCHCVHLDTMINDKQLPQLYGWFDKSGKIELKADLIKIALKWHCDLIKIVNGLEEVQKLCFWSDQSPSSDCSLKSDSASLTVLANAPQIPAGFQVHPGLEFCVTHNSVPSLLSLFMSTGQSHLCQFETIQSHWTPSPIKSEHVNALNCLFPVFWRRQQLFLRHRGGVGGGGIICGIWADEGEQKRER